MKIIKINSIIFGVLLLSGCYASNLNNMRVGMNKGQVIKVMGSPSSTAAHAGTEYMVYDLYPSAWSDYTKPYYIRLVHGKVDSFGMRGDFDSTRVYETKQTINVNVKNK
jgi:hypothetical protein